MSRTVPHEITLLAFADIDGHQALVDIVETSRHNAYRFIRAWQRTPDIASVATLAPGQRPADFLVEDWSRRLTVERSRRTFEHIAVEAFDRAMCGVAIGSERHKRMLAAADRRYWAAVDAQLASIGHPSMAEIEDARDAEIAARERGLDQILDAAGIA